MPYRDILNIPYDRQRILDEVRDLKYEELIISPDGKTAPDWLLASIPVDSYTTRICDDFVEAFETKLRSAPRVLRFSPPQVNARHVDEFLAKGVINLVIEDGFKVEIDDTEYDFHTSIFNIKRWHRLMDVHSTIHIIRMDVVDLYGDLLKTGIRKNLVKEKHD